MSSGTILFSFLHSFPYFSFYYFFIKLHQAFLTAFLYYLFPLFVLHFVVFTTRLCSHEVLHGTTLTQKLYYVQFTAFVSKISIHHYSKSIYDTFYFSGTFPCFMWLKSVFLKLSSSLIIIKRTQKYNTQIIFNFNHFRTGQYSFKRVVNEKEKRLYVFLYYLIKLIDVALLS